MAAPPETPETEPQSQSRGPLITPIRVVIGLCLFIPFIALLWVGSYSRTEPALAGMPFFYWYQMAWVLISAALTVIAYKLVKRDEARRRSARGEDGAR
ncbi:DUF3311 domain-containing protein [Streptomyces winkii]|uniref:DUF3311 domain-containing protein n=1 Tax=Streptomyces winkii TaxID=3051178 RepID=UPI0028D01765|nr:DUF3311 domain-containing protein [Streptomyces sp. DSM 40971]